MQQKFWMELGSRRSPGGVFLAAEVVDRARLLREPGGVFLVVEVVDGARLP